MSDSESPGFIPVHGYYQELLSYQKAEVVYDLTYRFCQRFLTKGDRTIDQMGQAARSGKQNIVEGCKVSATSKEMEIKLINVARSSLEELLADYLDFLRVRNHAIWKKDSKEATYVRKLGNRPHVTYEAYREICESRPAAIVANMALCLIHQTNYLLDQQIRSLEKDFVNEGGIREKNDAGAFAATEKAIGLMRPIRPMLAAPKAQTATDVSGCWPDSDLTR